MGEDQREELPGFRETIEAWVEKAEALAEEKQEELDDLWKQIDAARETVGKADGPGGGEQDAPAAGGQQGGKPKTAPPRDG
jgi:hypothetical protein